MKNMITLAFLALSSCAPAFQVECISKCGIEIVSVLNTDADKDSPPDGQQTPEEFCQGLGAYEAKMLEAFNDPKLLAADARFKNACTLLKGWKVQLNDHTAWNYYPDSSGVPETVYGLTYCDKGYSLIDNGGTTLGHEMAHAVQRCQPVPPIDPNDPDHSNWGPIYKALRDHGLRE